MFQPPPDMGQVQSDVEYRTWLGELSDLTIREQTVANWIGTGKYVFHKRRTVDVYLDCHFLCELHALKAGSDIRIYAE
jgi:hypothetical protein